MARSSTDIPCPQASNLNSLANGNAKVLGIVDFEANNAHDCTVKVKAQLASSGVSATGTLDVYFIATQNTVDWTDSISPSGSADEAANINNAVKISTIKADINSDIVTKVIDLFSAVGNGFKQGCVIVLNSSGAALQATGNDADYQTVNYG